MTRKIWKYGKPLDAFTSGYLPHRYERKAVREWTAARLRRQSPNQLHKWLDAQKQKAADALAVFDAMQTSAKVERAKANAKAHYHWVKLIRAELVKIELRRMRLRSPSPSPGYLKTEANAFAVARVT